MNEEVVLLLMLKLLWKARNVRAIPAFKNVRKFYFAYNVLLQQQKYIQENQNSGYS